MTEKITLATIFSLIAIEFSGYAPVLALLFLVIVVDYTTGLIKAFIKKDLSSQAGMIGVLKKISYLICIITAFSFDLLLIIACEKLGININVSFFGILISVILIINELLSICENLGEIGVPLPKSLIEAIKKLGENLEDF